MRLHFYTINLNTIKILYLLKALRCFLCLPLSLSLDLIILTSWKCKLFTVFLRMSRCTSPIELLLNSLVNLWLYIFSLSLPLSLSNREEELSFSAFFLVSRVKDVSDTPFVFFLSKQNRLHETEVGSTLRVFWFADWATSFWRSPWDALMLSNLQRLILKAIIKRVKSRYMIKIISKRIFKIIKYSHIIYYI